MLAKLMDKLQAVGRTGTSVIEAIGRGTLLLKNSLLWGGPGSAGFHDLLKQIYSVGVRSLIIIVVAGFFVGMVLTGARRTGARRPAPGALSAGKCLGRLIGLALSTLL